MNVKKGRMWLRVVLAVVLFLLGFAIGTAIVGHIDRGIAQEDAETALTDREAQELAQILWWEGASSGERATTCEVVRTRDANFLRVAWDESGDLDFDVWYGFVREMCAR